MENHINRKLIVLNHRRVELWIKVKECYEEESLSNLSVIIENLKTVESKINVLEMTLLKL